MERKQNTHSSWLNKTVDKEIRWETIVVEGVGGASFTHSPTHLDPLLPLSSLHPFFNQMLNKNGKWISREGTCQGKEKVHECVCGYGMKCELNSKCFFGNSSCTVLDLRYPFITPLYSYPLSRTLPFPSLMFIHTPKPVSPSSLTRIQLFLSSAVRSRSHLPLHVYIFLQAFSYNLLTFRQSTPHHSFLNINTMLYLRLPLRLSIPTPF